MEIAADQGRFEEEGWRIRKDGSRFWANVIINALRGPDGQLIGFSKITRDFTERKSAEESLILELSKAVLANPDISRILAAIEGTLQRLIPHDYAAIALFDASKAHELQSQQLPAEKEPSRTQVTTLSVEGTPEGWVFVNQEPLLMTQLDQKKAGVPSELLNSEVVVLAVRKEGGETIFNPSPELKVFAGDFLIVVGERSGLEKLEKI